MPVKDSIAALIHEAFTPELLEILDESHLHAGHEGAHAGGESHFAVLIVSDQFEGQSRLMRQRQILRLLAPLMQNGAPIHALRFSGLHTQAEWQAR